MGFSDQFACASLVAALSLALFIIANLFVESRASKNVMMPAVQHALIMPLGGNALRLGVPQLKRIERSTN